MSDNDSNNNNGTEVLYMTYEGNWLLECESRVVGIIEESSASDTTTGSTSSTSGEAPRQVPIVVQLDRTVFHAQGGGQPTDTGELLLSLFPNKQVSDNHADGITAEDATPAVVVMKIDKVSIDRSTGIVSHAGTTTAATTTTTITGTTNTTTAGPPQPVHLSIGDTVIARVDAERRRILSECHTAGHVVDAAMERCGKLLKPSKGYHFLDSPYVEYQGVIPPAEKDTLLGDLQKAFCELVEEDLDTKIALVSKDQANQLCNIRQEGAPNGNFDMDVFADKNDQVRVVTVAGFPCPCGGTHVRSTKDLKANRWGITGFKSKKGVVRVKYGQGCDV